MGYITQQIAHPDHVALAYERNGVVDGYLIANGEGYIDDYAVAEPSLWASAGAALLVEASRQLSARGIGQMLVVCGQKDDPKRTVLSLMGCDLVTEWYVRALSHDEPERPAI